MVVSITNLGFGDVVPLSVGGRTFVGIASMMGVLIAALWISAMRELLEIPLTEKRLLAAVRKARFRRIKIEAACRCIQTAWRYHKLNKLDVNGNSISKLDANSTAIDVSKANGNGSGQTFHNGKVLPEDKKNSWKNKTQTPSKHFWNSQSNIKVVRNHIEKSQTAERFHRALWHWKKVRNLNSDRFFTDFTLEDTHNLTRGLEKKLINIEKYMEDAQQLNMSQQQNNNAINMNINGSVPPAGRNSSHGTPSRETASGSSLKKLKKENKPKIAEKPNRTIGKPPFSKITTGWEKLREKSSKMSLRDEEKERRASSMPLRER